VPSDLFSPCHAEDLNTDKEAS